MNFSILCLLACVQLSANSRPSVKPAQQLGCYQHAGQFENTFENHFKLILSIPVLTIGLKIECCLSAWCRRRWLINSMYLFGIQEIENWSTKRRFYKSAGRTLWKEVVIKLRPACHSNTVAVGWWCFLIKRCVWCFQIPTKMSAIWAYIFLST